ncbi:MAG: hypothetical protein ACW97G_05015 [Candidatus Thorarchaeota archaeon]
MKRSIFPTLAIIGIVFISPVFASNHFDFEWVVSPGDRFDYSWTVEIMGTVVFQENIYFIIDHLDDIPETIDPANVWALSESGFEVSIYWNNGTSLNATNVQHTLIWKLFPVGNWSQLEGSPQEGQAFYDDVTYFGYEIYDLPGGTGIHKDVKFQKSNGVLDLYHMHEFVDFVAVTRLDIELVSSSTVTTTTTSSIPTSAPGTPDNSLTLIILAAAGGTITLVVVIFVIKR